MTALPSYRLSVAPMMDVTDRHFRFFARILSKHTLLYTPMITTYALKFGHTQKLLQYSPQEHPLALQLGGDDPADLAWCAEQAENFGYDEVNINVGCPSDRVQKGNFGACLMATPNVVADCVAAMTAKVKIPITVKHRIGIVGKESYEDMCNFVSTVSQAGCKHFIVHARIAILEGLNPKQNRSVPPLRYEDVYRLKKEFPHLQIVINGGVRDWSSVHQHLQHVDGVMIGRLAESDPYFFAEADTQVFSAQCPTLTRQEVLEKMLPYLEQEVATGSKLRDATRHLIPLMNGLPGARHWRHAMNTAESLEKVIQHCESFQKQLFLASTDTPTENNLTKEEI